MELEKLKKIITEVLNVDESEITMDTNPQEDLGSDSLMFVELIEMTADKYDLDIKLRVIAHDSASS